MSRKKTKLSPEPTAAPTTEKPLPSPDTLAMLAAQPRFAGEPDAETAITAALAFWRGVSVRLDYERRLEQSTYEHYEKPLENLKRPKNWPSKFNDFLRIVVQGKDEAEQIHRFRLWVSTWPSDPEDATAQKIDAIERHIKEARQMKFTKGIWEANAVSFRRFWKRHTRDARSRAGKRGAEIKAGSKKTP
jgi:hypothetical protein